MIRKDQQQQNAEYEQLSVASKKMKRKMWIVIGCIMLALGLLLGAVWLITRPNEQKNRSTACAARIPAEQFPLPRASG